MRSYPLASDTINSSYSSDNSASLPDGTTYNNNNKDDAKTNAYGVLEEFKIETDSGGKCVG